MSDLLGRDPEDINMDLPEDYTEAEEELKEMIEDLADEDKNVPTLNDTLIDVEPVDANAHDDE
jgi:hypothetical protein